MPCVAEGRCQEEGAVTVPPVPLPVDIVKWAIQLPAIVVTAVLPVFSAAAVLVNKFNSQDNENRSPI
ncbi:hypothetical protein C6A37_04360 [Desulfobacteraceae bacterium SEEP-SAG9]|nr:hypothetical protein C6A37_04360 [Desulfobacteraceae bacterium SEEP-SAG9]